MKILYYALFAVVLISTQVRADRYFSLTNSKEKRNYHSSLSELDSQSGNILTQIKLANNTRWPTKKMALAESKYLFFYTPTAKKKAQIQMIDLSTMQPTTPLEIDALNRQVLDYGALYNFKHLSDDQSHLYLHTGNKKSQKLTVIDLSNNQIKQQIKLSRYENRLSLSPDQQYLIITDTKNKQLALYDLDRQAIVLDTELNKRGHLGITHNNHAYITRYDGRHRDTRNSIADHMFGTNLLNDFSNTNYWIEATDLINNTTSTMQLNSTYAPVYAAHPKTQQLFVLSTTDKDKTAILHEIEGKTINEKNRYDQTIAPESMHIDAEFNHLLVLGGKDLAIINLSNLDQYTPIDRPFDVVNHFYDKSGQRLYLKEGIGSEVAIFDAQSGHLLGRSGTGRSSVKVGHAVAATALAAATGETGFATTLLIFSNTGMILNNSQKQLYVINSKTSDVTQFKASDLSDRKAIPTGKGTFFVYQSQLPQSPLWVFSEQQVNQISDPEFKVQQTIEFEKLVDIDIDSEQFLVFIDNKIKHFDMKTGAMISQWPATDADLFWRIKTAQKKADNNQILD